MQTVLETFGFYLFILFVLLTFLINIDSAGCFEAAAAGTADLPSAVHAAYNLLQ